LAEGELIPWRQIQVSAITTGAQPFIPDSNIFSKVIDKTIGASTPLNA
jgi:hypothetical protein